MGMNYDLNDRCSFKSVIAKVVLTSNRSIGLSLDRVLISWWTDTNFLKKCIHLFSLDECHPCEDISFKCMAS